MKRLLFVALLGLAAPAAAASLAVVNGTGQTIVEMAIRPTSRGTWQAVGGAQPTGSRQSISADTDLQCAFDIRARLAGGEELVYVGVNLCETSAVTLNRRGDGTVWVDYD